MKILDITTKYNKNNYPSIEVPPELELKQLPSHLKDAYLKARQKFPVIIATDLSYDQRCQLFTLLNIHKKAIVW